MPWKRLAIAGQSMRRDPSLPYLAVMSSIPAASERMSIRALGFRMISVRKLKLARVHLYA
ncbi:hypothetical protein SAMN05443247_06642 [Bradyrhizobium erythrophlei]|nr:hypothetical protein SAMN05443247_06642 [Bradyrhizobium erythrophlei]